MLERAQMGLWTSTKGYRARWWLPDVKATWAARHAGTRVHEVFASQSGYSTDWRCPLQRLAAVYAPGRAYSLRCVLCRIESMYLMSVRQLLPLRHLIYLCLMASSEQIPRPRT